MFLSIYNIQEETKIDSLIITKVHTEEKIARDG